MTTMVDIANRALISIGIPKQISSLTQDSVEAGAINSVINVLRDNLLRMAPWNCSFNFANLVYITSSSGTPENQSASTPTWQKGQPAPPWAYEYQYPVDCLRPCYVVPQFQSGFSGGVPITTALTGGAASFWQGPPVKFKVAIDQFFPVTAAAVAAGGTGYAVGDVITLASGVATSPPIGAPAQLVVSTIGGGGAVTAVAVVNQVAGAASPQGGSYFAKQTNPVAQGSTSGAGTGATFNLTFGSATDQRVVLCNQEFALMAYIKQVTDPNVMDPGFVEALTAILASRVAMTLIGDKSLANMKIAESNSHIVEARKNDANEGLTINDVTPDWIRLRGIGYSDYSFSPNIDFNWGNLWTPY